MVRIPGLAKTIQEQNENCRGVRCISPGQQGRRLQCKSDETEVVIESECCGTSRVCKKNIIDSGKTLIDASSPQDATEVLLQQTQAIDVKHTTLYTSCGIFPFLPENMGGPKVATLEDIQHNITGSIDVGVEPKVLYTSCGILPFLPENLGGPKVARI